MTTEKDPPPSLVLTYCVAWAGLLLASLAVFVSFMSAHKTAQRVDELWAEQHKWIELSNQIDEAVR